MTDRINLPIETTKNIEMTDITFIVKSWTLLAKYLTGIFITCIGHYLI